MPTHKLTKVYLESIAAADRDIEIRDTVVPGFLCKVTPSGRRVFMLSYRTLAGQRRKPALGTRKIVEVVRANVSALLHQLARRHITGNRVLACLRKMFNMAEV